MADTDKLAAEMLDRFERAAMAYERLGKLTKDDEKTREIRKAAIAELADARRAIFDILSVFDPSDVAWFEKEAYAEINKRKAAEATITALEAENKRLREALEPFAVFAEFVAGNHPGWDNDEFDIGPLFVGLVTMRDIRRARDISRNRRETPDV